MTFQFYFFLLYLVVFLCTMFAVCQMFSNKRIIYNIVSPSKNLVIKTCNLPALRYYVCEPCIDDNTRCLIRYLVRELYNFSRRLPFH